MRERLSQPVILALGGGAARGLAHIGILRGLAEDGVELAGVAGTSMGSIVGALAAQGLRPDEISDLFEGMDWPTVSRILLRSVVGSAFHELLREILGDGDIEALGMPFAAVCCDLDTGEEVVVRQGGIADAVRASSAIPGVLSPLRLGGRNLVDGAVVEPLPIAAAAGLGPHRVLAVNVLRPPVSAAIAPRPLRRPRRRGVRSAVRDRVDRWLLRQPGAGAVAADDAPGRLEAVMRSFHIMQYRLAAAAYPGAAAIEPEVGRFGWFDFPRAAEIVDEGYRAYRARFPRS
jgi:NTE family protein